MDIEKYTELMSYHRLFHSEFQIDHFITQRSGGTLYGCFMQALRELSSREASLKEMYSRSRWWRLRRETHEERFVRSELEREFAQFYAQAVALKQMLGDLSPERRRVLEEELWEYRIKESAALDYMTEGGLQRSTLEMLHCIPVAMRERVRDAVHASNRDELLEWWGRYDALNSVPVLQDPSCLNVRKMIGA